MTWNNHDAIHRHINDQVQALVRDILTTRDTAVNMHLADISEIERLLDALKAIECHSIDHTDACRMAGKARAPLEPKP